MSIVVSTITEEAAPPTTYGPCCPSLNGTWNLPFTEITDSYARWEETFDDYCETLELNVVAEISQLIPENCTLRVTFTVYDGVTPIFDMSFSVDVNLNSNCAAWDDLELTLASFNDSATMTCNPPSTNCFVTAV